MERHRILEMLRDVKDGNITPEEAIERMKIEPYKDLGFARLDNHRSLRKGFPEVVFCEGKTRDQVKQIFETLGGNSACVIGTRADRELYEYVKDLRDDIIYHESSRIIFIGKKKDPDIDKKVLVITAGTADIPVAEEAALTAEALGNPVTKIFDVGIAGVHRLFDNIETIMKANVIVVAAGMDGALPGLVAGLVDRPVIAVPTSVGYGVSFGGVSALLTMLNSCATGVAVVNIDNGFGAGYLAHVINHTGAEC